ncbi:hypothetical protein SISNIDRAFT_470637 [Sistotremastrum niveocremeum HHB9708]|uniref:Uncharacterized protein n=1 Tax=Sistotremastrum niveocremeum HHB9708 TaxID=1314777 RepID=A0A164NP16_9AGAM|nr:hypothetical protein SISNIDRAFT_470637 [Sistotremastrum niveocremeum HHB9708]
MISIFQNLDGQQEWLGVCKEAVTDSGQISWLSSKYYTKHTQSRACNRDAVPLSLCQDVPSDEMGKDDDVKARILVAEFLHTPNASDFPVGDQEGKMRDSSEDIEKTPGAGSRKLSNSLQSVLKRVTCFGVDLAISLDQIPAVTPGRARTSIEDLEGEKGVVGRIEEEVFREG